MDLWGESRNTGIWRRWVSKINVTIPLLNSHVLMVVNAWGGRTGNPGSFSFSLKRGTGRGTQRGYRVSLMC